MHLFVCIPSRRRRTVWRSCARAVAAVAAVAVPLRRAAAQAGVAVLPVASALPTVYRGNCPARIEFVGRVTVTVPGTRIAYRWERSDGDSSKALQAQIGEPSSVASDTTRVTATLPSDFWRAAAPNHPGVYWEILHVEAPIDVRSPPARVTIQCRN